MARGFRALSSLDLHGGPGLTYTPTFNVVESSPGIGDPSSLLGPPDLEMEFRTLHHLATSDDMLECTELFLEEVAARGPVAFGGSATSADPRSSPSPSISPPPPGPVREGRGEGREGESQKSAPGSQNFVWEAPILAPPGPPGTPRLRPEKFCKRVAKIFKIPDPRGALGFPRKKPN